MVSLKKMYPLKVVTCVIDSLLYNVLYFLLQIRLEATDEIMPGGAILNLTESKIIFKSVEDILQVHKKIEKQLLENLKYWNSVKKAEAFIIFVSFIISIIYGHINIPDFVEDSPINNTSGIKNFLIDPYIWLSDWLILQATTQSLQFTT